MNFPTYNMLPESALFLLLFFPAERCDLPAKICVVIFDIDSSAASLAHFSYLFFVFVIG